MSISSRTHRTPALAQSLGCLVCAALSACSQTHDDVDASTGSDAGTVDVVVEPDTGTSDPDATNADVTQPDTTSSDARRDTTIDSITTGDGPDCTQPVWNAASLTFTLTSSGGFVAPPPPDAGCMGIRMRYEFSKPDRTLAQHGCTQAGAIDRRVYLSDAQFDAILANISAMTTTCNKSCGADFPTMELFVAAAGVAQLYNSNFYAGCVGSTLRPPFVTFQALGALSNLLATTANAACSPDAGGPDAQGDDAGDANGGSCVPLPPDDAGVSASY